MAQPTDPQTPSTKPRPVPAKETAEHDRGGAVPQHAVQEQEQMQAATEQMAAHKEKHLAINEGGRTNDSSHTENPPGAVHGLPQPSLKGTWR